MRVFGAAALGAVALALPLAIGSVPANAQGNDVLGQVQRFLNNGNNGQNDQQDAYQRGREDEWRRQQAQREHRRDEHRGYGYNDRHYDNRYSENGPRYPDTYDNRNWNR